MIQIDDIRHALTAGDAADALDLMVRGELDIGHSPRQIYEAMKSLMPLVARLPEFAGDAEVDLHGIMDALRGWCHPACRYLPRERQPDAPAGRETEPVRSHRPGPFVGGGEGRPASPLERLP